MHYSAEDEAVLVTGFCSSFCSFFLEGDGFLGYSKVANRLKSPQAEMMVKSPKYPNLCLISLLRAATIRLLMMSELKRNA